LLILFAWRRARVHVERNVRAVDHVINHRNLVRPYHTRCLLLNSRMNLVWYQIKANVWSTNL